MIRLDNKVHCPSIGFIILSDSLFSPLFKPLTSIIAL